MSSLPNPADRRLDHGLAGFLFQHVDLDRIGVDAELAQRRDRRRALLLAPSGDRDRRPRLGHSLGHAEPDAAIAAGDQRYPSGKVEELHTVLPDSCDRYRGGMFTGRRRTDKAFDGRIVTVLAFGNIIARWRTSMLDSAHSGNETVYTARARYLTPTNAFREKLPPVPAMSFPDARDRALDSAAPTGIVACDIADKLASPVPATTPLLLARYLRVRAGESLATAFRATSEIYYVITGEGETENRDDRIVWAARRRADRAGWRRDAASGGKRGRRALGRDERAGGRVPSPRTARRHRRSGRRPLSGGGDPPASRRGTGAPPTRPTSRAGSSSSRPRRSRRCSASRRR